jgi:RNA polymerase sigma factor (sigma-70 family)
MNRSGGLLLSYPTGTGSIGCSEEELIAEAKRGSLSAFEQLVACHEARMFRVARALVHNHEDAEDVIQQCFQKAFAHLQSFEGRSSFSTWLTRIALNVALMLRRGRRFRYLSLDESGATNDIASALEIADSGPNPEHFYSQQERQRLLLSAINELKARIRMALQIRDLHERSVRETARLLGVSVGAAKSRVSRARRELRKKLKQTQEASTTRSREGGSSQAARGNHEFQFTS